MKDTTASQNADCQKAAFYHQLDALTQQWHSDEDSGQDEEEIQRENEIRRASRNFFRKPRSQGSSPAAEIRPSSVPHPGPIRNPRRTVSAPTPAVSKNHNHSKSQTVIEATPYPAHKLQKSRGQNTNTAVGSSFVEDTPLHDPQRAAHTPGPRSTDPITTAALSRSFSDQSPSFATSMSRKRKRNSTDKVVPESEQVLRGVSFFYIPNDEINPLRKKRIKRFRDYGAEWVQHISDASHVIVSDGLVYTDVEPIVAPVAGKPSVGIFNENYLMDCLKYRMVVDENPLLHRVKGAPVAQPPVASNAPVESATSQASKQSLEVKARQSKHDGGPTKVTPSQSQASPQQHGQEKSRKREPLESDSNQRVEVESTVIIIPSSQVSHEDEDRSDSRSATSGRPSGSGSEDELSRCINKAQKEFKNLPPLEDDDDAVDTGKDHEDGISDSGSGSGSESERAHKRRQHKKGARNKNLSFEERFACNQGGAKDDESSGDNPNARTIGVLQKMLDYYERTNDHWRILAYRKAINTLKRLDVKITTAEEAEALPNIGPRLSAKIEEIVNTNRLQRLEYVQNDPRNEVLKLFLGIYGVGLSTADKWVAKGFRTLDDLVQKATLTTNQRVGIDHYDDLNTRIPRAEVQALGDYVRREASKIDGEVSLLIGGSFRRGADSSGDIDFIITRKGTTSSGDLLPFLDKLVAILGQRGFLTASLAVHSGHKEKDGSGSKWHGCCVLPRTPGGLNDSDDYRPIWRRIDFLLVPETEYGAALIYFTGNDIFNRSMRLLASKKGMRLNQRGLYRDVMRGRGGAKITEGELLEGRDEKTIFELLGVKWREPTERWC